MPGRLVRSSARRAAPVAVCLVVGLLALAPSWASPSSAASSWAALSHPPSGAPPAARTFHVSAAGDDAASGTSPGSAWRTLARASRVVLGPGDRLLLARGSRFAATLTVRGAGSAQRPVVVSAYGTGAMPRVTGGCVVVESSFTTVRGILAHGCQVGFDVRGDHNRLSGVAARGNMHGVEVAASATGTTVTHSRLVRNRRMATGTPGPTDDHGAVGVVVLGRDTVVTRNLIVGHRAPSPDFGWDGSAVEIFGAVSTQVSHNLARDNLTFSELGHSQTADTVYVGNEVTSDVAGSSFLVTRGSGDEFGPTRGTLARGNTATLTGPGSFGFWCGGRCEARTLRLVGNLVRARGFVGYSEGRLGGRDNVWAGGPLHFAPLPGDRLVGSLLGAAADAVPLG